VKDVGRESEERFNYITEHLGGRDLMGMLEVGEKVKKKSWGGGEPPANWGWGRG